MDGHNDIPISGKVGANAPASGSTLLARLGCAQDQSVAKAHEATDAVFPGNGPTTTVSLGTSPCAAPLAPVHRSKQTSPRKGRTSNAAASPARKAGHTSAGSPGLIGDAAVESRDDHVDTPIGDAVVKKWQRHRAVRETRTASVSNQGSPSSEGSGNDIDAPTPSHSDSTSASTAPPQGDCTSIASKTCTADATKWRPTLRLRK
jgi:hypothetical protein